MINSNKSPHLHQNTDQFNSYFSSVPQFPLFFGSNKKQKGKNKKSIKSLFNQFHNKHLLSSKKEYQLQDKYQQAKKSKKYIDKNTSNSNYQIKDLVKTVHSTYFPKFGLKRTTSTKDLTRMKRSHKTVTSQSPQAALSRTGSTRRQTILQKTQYENIFNKCHLVLSIYQEKVMRLQKQNKRLLADNKLMKSKIKNVSTQSNF